VGEGLRLRDEDAVEVGYVSDLYELLSAIDEAIPKDATLCLEGRPVSEIRDYVELRAAVRPPKIEPGTIWPRQQFLHLPLEGANLAGLRALAERHAEPEIADHLMVYRDDEVLLWAPDAGDGLVVLAKSLPETTITYFRAVLGAAMRE
jgi:hypothetical protein